MKNKIIVLLAGYLGMATNGIIESLDNPGGVTPHQLKAGEELTLTVQ